MRRPLYLLLILFTSLASQAYGMDKYVVDVQTRLNVRSSNGKVIWKLYPGDTIVILESYGEKARIQFTTYNNYKHEGYVPTQYLQKIEQPEAAESHSRHRSSVFAWLWGLFKSLWVWIAVVIYLWVKRQQGYSLAWAILHLPDRLFYWLNQLQFYLQKPWRFLLHNPSNTMMWMHKHYVWVVPTMAMYVVSTPLRYINALYFNLVDRTVHAIFDSLGEVFRPTDNDMDMRYGWDYQWHWIVGFPFRLVYYAGRLALAVVEGMACTLFDTIVPTLTLYHGTTPNAAQLITEANNWQVGNGAYAGYGIYFGAQMRTARNYSHGVIVVSRVTLGWIENLNLHYYMRTLPGTHGLKGHTITQWAQDNHYTTIEWWRVDGPWWEYCMVDHSRGYDNPWRIRPMYVISSDTDTHHRIEGCVRLWFIPWLLKMIGRMMND